jgi:hypothetical protein
MNCLAPLIIFTILLTGCGKQTSGPLLAAEEQAIVGVYRLDNILLGPGRLVRLHTVDPMFEGMGDTLDQAAKKGLLTPAQVATLRQDDCPCHIFRHGHFRYPLRFYQIAGRDGGRQDQGQQEGQIQPRGR